MFSKSKIAKNIYKLESFQGLYILVVSQVFKNMLDAQDESSLMSKYTSLILYIFCIYSIFYFIHKAITLIYAGKKSISLLFLTVGVPTLTLLFFKLTQFSQSTRNKGSIIVLKMYAYYFILVSIKNMILRSDCLSAKNSKIIRFIKLKIVQALFRFYKYSFSQVLLYTIGIDYLDLSNTNLPKHKDFFLNFIGKNICETKFPSIDYKYYDYYGSYFIKCTFAKPSEDYDLEDFVRLIYRTCGYESIYSLPKGDYSNVSFYGIDLSETHFDKECILPKDINLFQYIKHKNLSETELPIDCLRNIHLYDLNDVKISLDLHDWYKDVLAPSQIALIMKKYPAQINKNIILPN